MTAQQYNDDFAWRNGFGGGLICGMRPDSEAFIQWTKSFQAKCPSLAVDGYFGPSSLERYEEIIGKPSVQVLGIDVSGHQLPSELDMAEMKALGRDVAGIKLVQGVGGESKHCNSHTMSAIKAGLEIFHYGFCSPWTDFLDDSVQEAERFFKLLQRYPDDQILAAVDFENKGYKQKKDDDGNRLETCVYGQEMYDLWKGRRGGGRPEYIQRMTDWIESYLYRFVELYGAHPMLYSYPGFIRDRIDLDAVDDILFEGPLWLASHTLGNPMVRHKMDKRFHLMLHQYSSKGDEETRRIFDHGLDLNRAPYGLKYLRR